MRLSARSILSAVVPAVLLVCALAPFAAAQIRKVTPETRPDGKLAYRIRGLQTTQVVSAALVRGQLETPLSLRTVRRAVRAGQLVVSGVSGRPPRLALVTDTRPPRTLLQGGPTGAVAFATAAFQFSATEQLPQFECRLDGEPWNPCNPPASYSQLAPGSHQFAVRARDAAGNVDATPATRSWTVDAPEASDESKVPAASPLPEPEPEDPFQPVPIPETEPPTTPEAAPEPALPEPTPSPPALVPVPVPVPIPPLPVPVPVAPVPPVPVPLVGVGAVFFDSFSGLDGVITNHYAYWSGDQSAHRSANWEMESGCALRSSGTLWSGVPTANLPNRDCSNGSGSEVFRLWTKRADFGDVRVSFDYRNNGYSAGSKTNPARSWDGTKVYLRRQDGLNFYTAEINRRQGNIIIQKKCPQHGGSYYLLAQVRTPNTPARIGEWETAGGSAHNLPGGSVRVQVIRNGTTALEAIDTGTGCAPITQPGRIGLRGDNTNFNIDNYTATPADKPDLVAVPAALGDPLSSERGS